MPQSLDHLIYDGEPVLSENDAWQFERSSGYAGYRNLVTGEWVYADEAPATLAVQNSTPSENQNETNSRSDSDVPF